MWKRPLLGATLLSVSMLWVGCGDTPAQLEPGLDELSALQERSIDLKDRIQADGGLSVQHTEAILTLEADIRAWNDRYDLPDVIIGGPSLQGAAAPQSPVRAPPGAGPEDCTFKCPTVKVTYVNGYQQICYLTKEICYTNGEVDCDYRCYFWPIWW